MFRKHIPLSDTWTDDVAQLLHLLRDGYSFNELITFQYVDYLLADKNYDSNVFNVAKSVIAWSDQFNKEKDYFVENACYHHRKKEWIIELVSGENMFLYCLDNGKVKCLVTLENGDYTWYDYTTNEHTLFKKLEKGDD